MPYKDTEKQRKAQREWWHRNKEVQKPKARKYKKKNRKKLNRKNAEYGKRKLSAVWLKTLKESLHCEICGEEEALTLDLHHIEPDKKLFGLNGSNARKNINDIIVEVNKCMTLCACCHRRVHKLIKEKKKRDDIAED